MKFANAIQATLVCSALAVAPAAAQDLFALPAAPASGTSTAPVAVSYSAGSLTSNGQFQMTPGAFRVLSNASGSKFYVLTSNAQTPLYSVSNNYTTVHSLPGVFYGINNAVLTPDGSTLYVISGTALVAYNVANDNPIPLPPIPLNTSILDLDASLDGSQVFVLLSSSGGASLEAISNVTHQILTNILPPSTPSAVAVGPNGLIYLSTLNTILEIDPNSYAVLHQYTINGTPGKLAFTPDGHYAIANNTVNNGTSPAITVLDLFANQIYGTIPSKALPPSTVLSNIWPISPTAALAYVQSTQQLYTISLSPLGIATSTLISAANTGNKKIVGVAVSSDVAAGSHATTQYLYFATNDAIQQINLATNSEGTGVFTPVYISAISYASPGLSGTPATLLAYGNNQQVTPGASSQPLVVRAVDGTGNPSAGVSVNFTGPAGVTITHPSVTTNMLGYASTTFVAPLTSGQVTIQAQTGVGVGATFNATVGASSGGSGIPASLKVVAGQGQLAYEVTLASAQGSPLSVLVNDSNGDPVPNIPVTFTLTHGQGSLVLYQGLGTSPVFNTIVAPTDKDGVASADMVTHSVPQIPGFDSEVITASISSGLSTPIYFTTVSRSEPATVQLKAPNVGTIYSGPAGSTIKGAFQFEIFSNSGPGLPNVSVQLLPATDPAKTTSASCVGVPLSNAQGFASCDLVFNGIVGTSQVTPLVGDLYPSLPFTIVVTAGPPANFVKLQGDNQTAKPGQALPLAAIANLVDSFGNILTNTPVKWSVTSGTATITQSTAKTDKNGTTLAYVTLGPIQGTSQITVSAGPSSAPAVANFTENGVVVPGGLNPVSGNNQTADVSQAFTAPLVVQALDNSNNPVQGVTVAFATTSGGVTLSAPSAVTDASGNASVTATAPATAGASVVTATYGSFSAAFNLTAIFPGPSNVSFLNAASFQLIGAAPGAIAPGEIVSITGNNLTPGVTGVVTPPAGTLPVTLNGVQVLFGGIAAPLFAVVNQNGQEQINALVPFELASGGTTSVTISNNNGSGTFVNVPVQPLAPGFFTSYYNNQSYAVAIRASDGSYISPQNLAKPGDTVIAFVNGLGQGVPVIGSTAAGAAQTVGAPLSVTVNGVSVGDVPAVYQSQAYGVYLVTFQVPQSLQSGLYPLTLSAVGPDSNTYAAASSFIPVGQ